MILSTAATNPTTGPQARKPRRALRRGIVTLAVLAVIALIALFAAAIWLRHAMHASLPQVDGNITVAGLSAPVTVTRDPQGIPSITAANLDDVLFAQGYVTAQDRLFQMDALRRHASGELAEILGPSLVEHDRLQRYLQIRAAADRAVAALPPSQLQPLEAYARGVNAFITTHLDSLPVEFHLLHYQPAAWTPRDSLLISLVMSQELSTEFPQKLNREALSAHLPPALAADLYPITSVHDHPPGALENSSVTNSQSSTANPQVSTVTPADLLRVAQLINPCAECVAGSNNWAVSAEHTASGAPIVSNDMHLNLSAPDIWYQAALHGGPLNVTGFTLPGVPFVIVGRNANVAWGFTALLGDIQDVRIEHLMTGNGVTQFQHADGSWQPVTHNHELIRVRGGIDVSLDVLSTTATIGDATVSTPIISPLYPSEHRALSLLWTIYDPSTVSAPLLAIDTATDGPSLLAAFSNFRTPTLSLVYADAHHIGFHTIGRIPVRGPAVQNAGHIGSPISSVPIDALDPSQIWSGYIPYDQLPAVTDPPGGILATANSRVTPDDYSYFIANDWFAPYRTARIYLDLSGRNGLTPTDSLAVDNDLHSELALVLAQHYAFALDHAGVPGTGPRMHQAADLLRSFDGNITVNSAGASLVAATNYELYTLLLSAQIQAHDGDSIKHPAKDQPTLDQLLLLYTWHNQDTALENLVTQQPARWLPAGYANWNDLIVTAVAHALRKAPSNLNAWSYGQNHPVEIAHPLFGSHGFVSLLLGVATGTGRIPNGGNSNTIRASGLHFGPSERFTADMSSSAATFANITSGESENPASPHFLDQFPSLVCRHIVRYASPAPCCYSHPYVHTCTMMQLSRTPPARFLILPFAAFIVVLPLFMNGCSCGHDFSFHISSWLDAAQQIRHGVLLPRWDVSAAWNSGEPRFLFYPPLSWLLGALLTVFSPAAAPILFTWIALTAAAFCMHHLAREFTSSHIALLAAALYIVNPYMLFTAYERTAYGELLAAAWLPLLVAAALATRPRITAIALPIALLWLTNAPAAVIGCYGFAVVIAVRIVLLLLDRKSPVELALRSIAGTALGAALAGFYLVPAAYERRFVQIKMAVIPDLRVQDNFLFSHTASAAHDTVLRTASQVAFALLVLTVIPLILLYLRPQKIQATRIALSALTLLIAFCLTPLSSPLFNHLPELAFLQFPWRMLSLLGVVFALAVALLLHDLELSGVGFLTWWHSALRGSGTSLVITAVTACSAFLCIHLFSQSCELAELPAVHAQLFDTGHGEPPTDEYTPITADNDTLRTDDPAFWLAGDPQAFAPNTVPNPIALTGNYDEEPPIDQTVSTPAPHHLALDLSASQTLILNLRDYPAWQVARNGELISARIERDDGLIAIPLPAGHSTIDIAWRRTSDQLVGLVLTTLALLILGFLSIHSYRRYAALPSA